MSKKKVTEEVYDVEAVLGYKKSKKVDKYLVKWVGYKDPTWEPVELLDNCRHLIVDFWKKKAEKKEDNPQISMFGEVQK